MTKARTKKKNPRGQHLPGLPAKAQREYEEILASAKAEGRYKGREKEVAARTVRKQYGKNPVDDYGLPVFDRKGDVWPQLKRAHKASIAKREKYHRDIVDYARRLYSQGKYTDAQIWQATWNRFGYQGDVKSGVLSLVIDGKVYKVSLAMPNARRKKNTTVIKAKKIGRVIVRKAANPKGKPRMVRFCSKCSRIVKGKSCPAHPGAWVEKIPATTGQRSRNLGHKDSDHPVEVTHHFRAGPPGYLTPWQRAHHAGQKQLLETGIKPAKKRNASAGDSAKWEKLWSAYINALKAQDVAESTLRGKVTPKYRAARMRVAKAEKAIEKFDPDAYRRYIVGKGHRNAAKSRNSKQVSSSRAGASRHSRKSTRPSTKRTKKNQATPSGIIAKAVKRVIGRNPSGGQYVGEYLGVKMYFAGSSYNAPSLKLWGFSSERSLQNAIRKALSKRTGNPSASSIRKNFAGRHDRDSKLRFPDGTPTGLAKLGRLVSISTESGRYAPVNGVAWLCSDTRGKLHIGTPTKGHVIFGGPAHNYGHVKEIEYEESKPHLGYTKKTIFFHKLGEETGQKPRLVTDGKGGAKFVGGAYKIKREGIIN